MSKQYGAALAVKNECWIDWTGGECPVEKDTLVDVRYRDSQTYPDRIGTPALVAGGYGATYHHWLNDGMRNDIIAYRLHQPQKAEKARAAAWNAYAGITESDGESDLNECIGQGVEPVWNGEGLPPIGCECEVSVDGGRSWCTYKAINEKNGARLIEIGNFTEEFQSNNWMFRPLRTEAERAIDEMVQLSGVSIGAAKILYDAGYRK